MTHWVAKAWKILHEQHKDTIVNTFRNLGISLNPDGSEDSELRIRDLPNIEVGDYALTEEYTIIVDAGTPSSADLNFQNPITPLTMELRSQTCTTSTRRDLYYTAAEVAAEVPEIKDESNVTIDSEDEIEDQFDIDSDDDFDPESDEDAQDMNMRH